MRAVRLTARGFRNAKELCLEPQEGVNVLYGNNAQGKTNLLEALWYFTGAKSFRGAKDSECIAFGEKRAQLSLSFFAQGREQEASIALGEGKKILLNEVEKSSLSALTGSFCAVVFAPTHLRLVKDGPGERRRFLDAALCQLRPGYRTLLGQYQRAMFQRNTLLRDYSLGLPGEMLDIWEEAMAKAGSEIVRQRCRYVEALSPFATEVYDGLSSGKERFALRYEGEGFRSDRDGRAALLKALRDARSEDLRLGCATVGPHRDELTILIDDRPARLYGSQGQQRSAALALKLGEASVLRDFSDELPVALLDDVMSELDPGRQSYILNRIQGWQVFLTCCDPAPILRCTGGACFEVDGGRLRRADDIRGRECLGADAKGE